MKILIQIFFIVAVSIIFTGCEHMYNQITKPRPYGLAPTPEGTAIFKQGWEDGCDTGLSAYGNDTYKRLYTFKQDLVLVDNPEYYRAWKDAYLYCRWYAWNWVRDWMQ